MTAPSISDAETTPSRAVVVSDASSAESEVQRDRRFLDETYGKMTSDRKEQDRYMERLGLITAYRMWISEQNT